MIRGKHRRAELEFALLLTVETGLVRRWKGPTPQRPARWYVDVDGFGEQSFSEAQLGAFLLGVAAAERRHLSDPALLPCEDG